MDKYCMRMLYAFLYTHGHYGRGKICPGGPGVCILLCRPGSWRKNGTGTERGQVTKRGDRDSRISSRSNEAIFLFSGENSSGAKDSLPLADHDESAYDNHMALYEVSLDFGPFTGLR